MHRTLTADKIVIATGTMPARPANVDFDGLRVLDSDQILDLEKVPDSMVVVGAGVIGVEYASMFAALGTRVTLVEKRPQMLDFCDPEIVESLKFHLRDHAMSFRFGEEVASVESWPRGTITTLASGKRIAAEVVMHSAGRQGNTVQPESRRWPAWQPTTAAGSRWIEHYRTEVDRTSMPSATLSASRHWPLRRWTRVGWPPRTPSANRPTSCAACSRSGSTRFRRSPTAAGCEAELTSESIPFEVGISRYRELARGQITGDSYGMLKLIVHSDTREILGVHVFGTNATELVHIGQAVMGCGGTVDYLVDTVFNYPTLSEAYKVAALDVDQQAARGRALPHPARRLRSRAFCRASLDLA